MFPNIVEVKIKMLFQIFNKFSRMNNFTQKIFNLKVYMYVFFFFRNPSLFYVRSYFFYLFG